MAALARYVLIGGVVLAAITFGAMCRNTGRNRKRADERLDNALDDTFPASDPTATQDFAIPANRV